MAANDAPHSSGLKLYHYPTRSGSLITARLNEKDAKRLNAKAGPAPVQSKKQAAPKAAS